MSSKLLKSISKKIDIDREVISVLPKNGIKQLKTLEKKMAVMIDKYSKMNNSILKEMNRRYDSIVDITSNPEIEAVRKQILELDNLGISDEVPSSYEKMGLDKYLYIMNGYYKKDLGTINKEIVKCVKKFKEVGITLTKQDFNISEYVSEYMGVLLDCASKGDLHLERIKTTFDKVYWKCSDIIPHIIVNFRIIYDRNEAQIDTFYRNRTQKTLNDLHLTKEQIENKKEELVLKLNSLIDVDGKIILDNFLSNTYLISDYKRDNYDKIYERFAGRSSDDLTKEEKAEMDVNIKSLHNHLIEYSNYLEFKFLIDEILKLREEKLKEIEKEEEEKKNKSNKNKKVQSEYEKVKEDIKNLTGEIERLNGGEKAKGKFGFFKKKETASPKDDSTKILERDNKILELKELYTKFDTCRLKESIASNINETSKLYDVLRIASFDYLFLAKAIIKKYPDIIEKDIHSMIDRIRKFVRLYNFSVINNINISEKKDISIVIKDKYKLFGMNLTKENFSEAGLEELIKDVQLVNNYNNIVRSNILLEDIRYVVSAREILKK